jgi:hypothetical protein
MHKVVQNILRVGPEVIAGLAECGAKCATQGENHA